MKLIQFTSVTGVFVALALLFRVEPDHVVDAEYRDRRFGGKLQRFDLGYSGFEYAGGKIVSKRALG